MTRLQQAELRARRYAVEHGESCKIGRMVRDLLVIIDNSRHDAIKVVCEGTTPPRFVEVTDQDGYRITGEWESNSIYEILTIPTERWKP